jgi:hypothetical protein
MARVTLATGASIRSPRDRGCLTPPPQIGSAPQRPTQPPTGTRPAWSAICAAYPIGSNPPKLLAGDQVGAGAHSAEWRSPEDLAGDQVPAELLAGDQVPAELLAEDLAAPEDLAGDHVPAELLAGDQGPRADRTRYQDPQVGYLHIDAPAFACKSLGR